MDGIIEVVKDYAELAVLLVCFYGTVKLWNTLSDWVK
jgi:hypothetical protein